MRERVKSEGEGESERWGGKREIEELQEIYIPKS